MKLYKIFSIALVFIFILGLCSCQSIDQTESYFDTSGIPYTKYEYDTSKNETKITWATTLTNDTIYNIYGFSVKLELYSGTTLVNTETFNYDKAITHGEEYTGSFYFITDGKIDKIEYVSWSANYNSFWETYQILFIITISLVAILAIIYIIIMIIQDLELDDIGEFISDNLWILICLTIPFGSSIYSFITSSWVTTLIILGGTLALAILILLSHLVKYIIEEGDFDLPDFSDLFHRSTYSDEDRCEEETDDEDISNCIDESKLQQFTVNELREYCRENNIRGFSSLNKQELIQLIIFQSDTEKESIKRKKSTNIRRITFDDIAGLEEAKKAFKEKVVLSFQYKELYEKFGKKSGGGILLYGLPGTGKTIFAEAASNEVEALFIPIKCSDIKSKWYGESENKIKTIFDKARKAKRAIIFFDEFEAIGAKRTDDDSNGNNDLVPQILAEMQGVNSENNGTVLVIAATNKPWAIDSAFLRPGRFDEKIYIPLPDFEARKRMFELKLSSVPQLDIDYDYLANISEGFNGADISEFCDKLKMQAIHRSIEIEKESPITMQDVALVKASIKTSVMDEDLERLKDFMQ